MNPSARRGLVGAGQPDAGPIGQGPRENKMAGQAWRMPESGHIRIPGLWRMAKFISPAFP